MVNLKTLPQIAGGLRTFAGNEIGKAQTYSSPDGTRLTVCKYSSGVWTLIVESKALLSPTEVSEIKRAFQVPAGSESRRVSPAKRGEPYHVQLMWEERVNVTV